MAWMTESFQQHTHKSFHFLVFVPSLDLTAREIVSNTRSQICLLSAIIVFKSGHVAIKGT